MIWQVKDENVMAKRIGITLCILIIMIKRTKGQPYSEMKRFVFIFTERGPYGTGLAYMLDTHSRRIYCGRSGTVSNAYECQWVVDLEQRDIDNLVRILEATNLHGWKGNIKDSQRCEYGVGVEYQDGSVEAHFVRRADANIRRLEEYFEQEIGTFKERMLQDRKTTPNIDYLISYLGWDPTWDVDHLESFNIYRHSPWYDPPEVTLEGVDRIVIFEAEGSHTVRDHSRKPQKTLLLDILNGRLFYEPERAVYEQIHKSSVVRQLSDEEVENIVSMVSDGIAGWKANEMYISKDTPLKHAGICNTDIPPWCIGIQYADGRIAHYSGDGFFEDGWAPGGRELLDRLFATLSLE